MPWGSVGDGAVSESWGTLRYGRLPEVLLYDVRRMCTLDGPSATYLDPEVERWLLGRSSSPDVTHVKLLADRVDIDTPRELFRAQGPFAGYEPTPDGQRFLMPLPPTAVDPEADPGAGELKIISNWQALVK